MSLYPEHEITASVYHPDINTTTKVDTYPGTADFTIDMFIIRMDVLSSNIMGEELGSFVANVNASYSNAGNIKQGDKIVADGVTYIVTTRPKYLYNFNKYKMMLRATDR
jgi:hypothetical protein